MNNILRTIMFMLITAQGTAQMDRLMQFQQILPRLDVHPLLLPTLREFVKDANKYNAKMDIRGLRVLKYGKLPPGTIGLCVVYPALNGTNILRKEMYIAPYLPSMVEKAVIYHELGHCLLGLDHSPQESGGLMTPVMQYNEYYKHNWNVLLKDFFQKGL